LHCFQDIIVYFLKFKYASWPWPRPLKGHFVISMLNCNMATIVKKFEVSSFSRSGDILGAIKNSKGSRDQNYAPILGWFIIPLAQLDIVSLCTEFDSSRVSAIPEIWMGPPKVTSGSAMAEGPRDALVSRNSATTKHPIWKLEFQVYRVALFAWYYV